MQRLVFILLAVFIFSPAPAKDSTAAKSDAAYKSIKVCIPQFREEFATLALVTAQEKGVFAQHGLKVEIVAAPTQQSLPRSHSSYRFLLSD